MTYQGSLRVKMLLFTVVAVFIIYGYGIHDKPMSQHSGTHSGYVSLWAIKKRFASTCIQTSPNATNKCIFALMLLLAGDIQSNPGPAPLKSIFPCGLCQYPVTWSQVGVCCDNCSLWHHKSCMDLCTQDIDLLERSSVQWLCCKCDSINVDNFTFHSFEFSTSNLFHPLQNQSLESVISSQPFSPLHTSSPVGHSGKSHCSSFSGTQSLQNDKTFSLKAPPKTNLRLLTINCRSIRDKSQEYKALLEYTKPDIVCGTESWLRGIQPGKAQTKTAIKNAEIFPENYNTYRNDRSSLAGGVFVSTQGEIVTEEQVDLVTQCEIEWVKCKVKGKSDLYVGSFYMPHRKMQCLQELRDSLLKLTSNGRPKHIILTGDFNCPDINWASSTVNTGCPDRDVQQYLVDLAIEFGLYQLQESPTRMDKTLDLVFTTNTSLFKCSNNLPGISDHDVVISDFDIRPTYQKCKPRKGYIFSKADWPSIKNKCKESSSKIIEDQKNGKNVEELWTNFKKDIEKAVDTHVPSKIFNKKKSLPWLNNKLRRMTKRKARLYSQAKKTNKWADFRKFQKKCKAEFRRAENDYINNVITEGLAENNSKPFWRYVKSKKKDNIGTAALKSGTNLISESKGKAEILLEQFKSVFTRDQSTPSPTDLPDKPIENPLSKLKITTIGVEKLLQKVKTSKAVGPDLIQNRVLKECASELAPGLTTIFQCSVDSGDLPSDWLSAFVTPVFKKGDVHQASNYRPVSLTSVSCKLLEHIVCKHLLDHFDSNSILTNLNHGFRSGFSCETQLLATTHDIFSYYDSKTQVDIAILDFSKAFDTVPHAKLLAKLQAYGIHGNLHTWLTNFLTQRSMQVVVNGEHSSVTHVDSGVPQGTVLGPLLFLVHINDLPLSVKSQVRLFADDCLLYRPIKSQADHKILQDDLQQLEIWAKTWGMRFNATKCYVMSTSSKSNHFYSLDNHILQQVSETPYLGITLSEDLKWTSHISKTAKKASSVLGFVRRNLNHCPDYCKKTAYIALVRSIMEYAAVVWDPYTVKEINVLERVQRQAARFIEGNYTNREDGYVTSLLSKLDLQPLQTRRRDLRLTLMYKITNEQIPALNPADYLVPNTQRRRIRPTRFTGFHTSNIVESSVVNNTRGYQINHNTKSQQFKNSFFNRTVIDWNHLAEDTVQAATVEGFKESLQGWSD